MDGDAKKLGERLLGEVETEGLSELFASLREFNNVTFSSSSPPLTIDLLSPPYSTHPSGGGKSTLTQLLIVHAILPQSLLGVSLNGASSSIVLVDPLSHFRASRLTEFLLHHLTSTLSAHGQDVRSAPVKEEVLRCVRTALSHVLIYRPSSWASLVATLDGLPGYLFDDDEDAENSDRGSSGTHGKLPPNPLAHRRLHAIILEDIHSFIPHLRSTAPPARSNAIPSPLSLLTPQIRTLHKILRPSVIMLTSLSPLAANANAGSIVHGGITRLAVRRIDVPRFAPGISIEEAEAERELRWKVVERGRFEVWRVGAGEAVVFRIRGAGDVVVEGGDDGGGSEMVTG
ncbi:hypothetical protein DM02DRAFT_534595 [Periconia macrospinosa]|uniref:DNA recombination and repair protein Rad51-like C-terminal domain-containing protein n=1 Tax=Periconia macrospinosa TaxID=97972 RepID=A0A2V1DF53_9PLEO|nr:hypothetical protein DM02DRAFT_534595 [Periconia macrospinosa]